MKNHDSQIVTLLIIIKRVPIWDLEKINEISILHILLSCSKSFTHGLFYVYMSRIHMSYMDFDGSLNLQEISWSQVQKSWFLNM